MNNKSINRLGSSTEFLDLFKKSQNISSENISVATLGKIKSISQEISGNSYGIAEVMPIPLWAENVDTLETYFFSDNFSVGDMVLAVFTDRDFRDYLQKQGTDIQTTKNTILHSKMFGILIKL